MEEKRTVWESGNLREEMEKKRRLGIRQFERGNGKEKKTGNQAI